MTEFNGLVAIHKENNDVDSKLCYYARDLAHLIEQFERDGEKLSEYELFTVGDPLEIQLVVKS